MKERLLSEEALFLPISDGELLYPENIIQQLKENSAQLIQQYRLHIDCYNVFERKAKAFFCLKQNYLHLSTQEYLAYLLSGFLVKETNRPNLAAQYIQNIFPDTFPIASRKAIEKWFPKNDCGYFPTVMSAVVQHEKKYPEAFNETYTDLFFENGFGSLLAYCTIRVNNQNHGIGGHERTWMFSINRNSEFPLSSSLERKLNNLKMALSYKHSTDITNVVVARYMQIIQQSAHTEQALSLLPEKTVVEFLYKLTDGLLEHCTKKDIKRRPRFSSTKDTVRHILLRYVYRELCERGYEKFITRVSSNTSTQYEIDFKSLEKLTQLKQSLEAREKENKRLKGIVQGMTDRMFMAAGIQN